jgi:glutathione S-transferase
MVRAMKNPASSRPALTLYFSPLACSFASRAVVHELDANVRLVQVDRAHKLPDGRDYREIHPLRLVPALQLEDGEILTESAAVLQYLGDTHPEGHLTPTDPRERSRLHSWLSFIGTELHKVSLGPLISLSAPAEAKAYALAEAGPRIEWLAKRLEGRSSVLDSGLSVADAYLCAILNWTRATPIDLGRWPGLRAYHGGLLARPAFARALKEEMPLWAVEHPEQARVVQQRA